VSSLIITFLKGNTQKSKMTQVCLHVFTHNKKVWNWWWI